MIGRRNTNLRSTAHKEIQSLPDDMVSDLRDAFSLYDRENSGRISMANFRNILHNFGFWRVSKKEMEEEIRNQKIEVNSRRYVQFGDVVNVVTAKWCNGGREDEARDSFRIFDKKDRGTISVNDVKEVLQAQLDFPVGEIELNELMNDLDPNQTGLVTFDSFLKVYNQSFMPIQKSILHPQIIYILKLLAKCLSF